MKQVKRLATMVVGGTVLAVGVALLVLPGPAFLVIPLGLAILAAEFAWARRWLHKARELLRGRNRAAGRKGSCDVSIGSRHTGSLRPSISFGTRRHPDRAP